MATSEKNLALDAFGNVAEVAGGLGESETAELERHLAEKRFLLSNT